MGSPNRHQQLSFQSHVGLSDFVIILITVKVYKVSYMPLYRVKMEEVRRGKAVEMKEHPTMSPATAARTARQHLQHHPMYYQVEPQFEKMLIAREKNIKPIQKVVQQNQRKPFF